MTGWVSFTGQTANPSRSQSGPDDPEKGRFFWSLGLGAMKLGAGGLFRCPLVRAALMAIAAATVPSGAVVAGQRTPSQYFSECRITAGAEKFDGDEIFPDEQQGNVALVDSVGLKDTSADDWRASQRFYLSGIVGASFANLSSGGLNTASEDRKSAHV